MQYAIVFPLLAAYLLALGAILGGPGRVLLWPGVRLKPGRRRLLERLAQQPGPTTAPTEDRP
jgi:hypothetical protein